MKAQQVLSILAAVGTLLGGCILALGGDGLGAGVTFAFLIAAPATAVAVSLRGMDPLARIVLALAAALVVNALVAELMLAVDRWSIPGGVVAVGVISAVMWLATSATSVWSTASADSRREVIAHAENADGDGRRED